MSEKVIAVYGSARTQSDHTNYQTAYDIGAALAHAGYIVMTGGYQGLMEAASKGAHEANGEVYGVTTTGIESIGESRLNEWVTKQFHYSTLPQRIHHLIERADGYIVMPGEVGTMQEFAEVWQRMRVKQLPQRPLMIYGNFWQPMIDSMLDAGNIGKRDLNYIVKAQAPADIITVLNAWYKSE